MLSLLSLNAALAAGAFVEEDVELLWELEEPLGVNFGWALSPLADVDGDGAAEIITSDPFVNGNAGEVVVLSGRTGERLFSVAGGAGTTLGFAIADAGDLDGDGLHDLVVGAAAAGRVRVLSGADGADLLQLTSPDGGGYFGSAVSSAGDVDGDGVPDLLVGAELCDRSAVNAGCAYLISGADRSVLHTWEGEAAGDHFGSGTGLIGDINGDGVPDGAIGARDAGPIQAGRVYVYSGADGAILHVLEENGPGGSLGYFFVDGVGDIDGDGISDVFGGDFNNVGQGTNTGAAFVWSGADGSLIHRFAGPAANEGLGTGRGAGDIDGDGIPDLSVGSWTSSLGAAQAGRITVFSGADGAELRTVTSLSAGENLGFDVVGVGDVNGDGGNDLVASGATLNRVYLILGEPAPMDSGPVDTGVPAEKGCGCAGGPAPSGTSAVIWAALLLVRRRSH